MTEITLQLYNLRLSWSIAQSKQRRTHRQLESRSGKLILATWVSATVAFKAVPKVDGALFNCSRSSQQSAPGSGKFVDKLYSHW